MVQKNPVLRTSSVFAELSKTIFKSYLSSDITKLKKDWATNLLMHLNLRVQVIGQPLNSGPVLILGNHISYVDIPLLVSLSPQISFLAKSDLKYWPLINLGAYKMKTVFVRRGSAESREKTKNIISEALLNNDRMIAAFPSGTTCLDENKSWRHGLFEIAYNSQVPIQPFRIHYFPLRPIAYIDKDKFLSHLYKLVQLQEIKVQIEYHKPVMVLNPKTCSQYWQKWTQENWTK